jgi:hypothetical protein
MKTPSSWRRKPKHKSLKIAKGELWKFILRNDFSFWKPKPANWFHCSCSSRSLSCCCCYFPSSSIKNSTKLTHICTKTVVLLHPRIPCSSFPFVFLCRASLLSISYFVFVCVRRACVCLRCLAVVCRCVECARGLVRACSREPKSKEEKNTRREKERERKFTEITYVISA